MSSLRRLTISSAELVAVTVADTVHSEQCLGSLDIHRRSRRRIFASAAVRQSVARSGLKSVAQGSPWVVLPTRISPEGADEIRQIIGSARLNRTACAFLAPSGRNVYFRLTQGKPWAKLFWSLRATDWKRPKSRSRHFVPGYYRAVPPGQKPFSHRSASHYGKPRFGRSLTLPADGALPYLRLRLHDAQSFSMAANRMQMAIPSEASWTSCRGGKVGAKRRVRSWGSRP